MIEIFALISLGKNIAAKAREKGRSGGPFVLLLVVLWFVGEIFGAIVAGVVAMIALGDDEPNMLILYLGAIPGAIIGAVVAFQIVKAIAPANTRGEYDDEDEYDRPDRDRDRY